VDLDFGGRGQWPAPREAAFDGGGGYLWWGSYLRYPRRDLFRTNTKEKTNSQSHYPKNPLWEVARVALAGWSRGRDGKARPEQAELTIKKGG